MWASRTLVRTSCTNIHVRRNGLDRGLKCATCPHLFHPFNLLCSACASQTPQILLHTSNKLSYAHLEAKSSSYSSVENLLWFFCCFTPLTSLPFFNFVLPRLDSPLLVLFRLSASPPQTLQLLLFHPHLMLTIPELCPWLFSYSPTCSDNFIHTCGYKYRLYSSSALSLMEVPFPSFRSR